MADKEYSLKFDIKTVNSTSISKYSDGYNHASIGCKLKKNEWVYVSYEWSGDTIPDFVMDIMDMMKSINQEQAGVVDPDSMSRAGRILIDRAAKAKPKEVIMDDEEEICPECKNKKSECKCKPKKK